ncbi:hypothetical protein [Nocardia camponoti]|uniref:hypothetical protein n=1 Tax=Nocardia camponoti TaxID=1616106 RepID=UPI00166C4F66|nr:hypothetical protein [Nocardia camponoti]
MDDPGWLTRGIVWAMVAAVAGVGCAAITLLVVEMWLPSWAALAVSLLVLVAVHRAVVRGLPVMWTWTIAKQVDRRRRRLPRSAVPPDLRRAVD